MKEKLPSNFKNAFSCLEGIIVGTATGLLEGFALTLAAPYSREIYKSNSKWSIEDDFPNKRIFKYVSDGFLSLTSPIFQITGLGTAAYDLFTNPHPVYGIGVLASNSLVGAFKIGRNWSKMEE